MRAILWLTLVLAAAATIYWVATMPKSLPKPLDAYPDQEGLGKIARWHLDKKSYRGKENLIVLIS